MGWVHRRRDLGGLIFVHLRDREGTRSSSSTRARIRRPHARAEELSSEFVIAVEGIVETAAPRTRSNPNIATGEVEVVVDKIWIFNESRRRRSRWKTRLM